MGIGSAATGNESVENTAYLTIQPGSGIEWCIHNIMHGDDCELYLTDGTNDILIDSGASNGAWLGYAFFITNTDYLRVKNVSGVTARFGYTGVVTVST